MKTTATPQAAQMVRICSVKSSALSWVSARSAGSASCSHLGSYGSQ
jgi:hypothetical protein